jgi:hypothetical protein
MIETSSTTRRGALVLTAGAMVAGCAIRPPAPRTKPAALTLEEAFVGRTVGEGVFSFPIARVNRRFGALLYESAGCVRAFEKRKDSPPGMHPRSRRTGNYGTASPPIYTRTDTDTILDTSGVISSVTLGLEFGSATFTSGTYTVWGSTS